MFLRIDLPHRLKFEVPHEVQLIFEFLGDASPPPPSRITLCVIRRGGVPSARSHRVIPGRNQALLSGAPLWLAVARLSLPSLRAALSLFIRSGLTVDQFTVALRLGTLI
jgi:hypothetical protein